MTTGLQRGRTVMEVLTDLLKAESRALPGSPCARAHGVGVNRLEEEIRVGKAGHLAARLSRLELVVLDELGYLPFARSGGQMLFHLVSKRLTNRPRPSPPAAQMNTAVLDDRIEASLIIADAQDARQNRIKASPGTMAITIAVFRRDDSIPEIIRTAAAGPSDGEHSVRLRALHRAAVGHRSNTRAYADDAAATVIGQAARHR